jgi:hypothetical protein
MLSSSKEIKNIPISFSILHEQEYNNLYYILRSVKNKKNRRRAFSEKSTEMNGHNINEPFIIKFFNQARRKTLKN